MQLSYKTQSSELVPNWTYQKHPCTAFIGSFRCTRTKCRYAEANEISRLELCDKFLHLVSGDEPVLFATNFSSDEANTSGHVNKENMRCWAEDSPHASVEKPSYREESRSGVRWNTAYWLVSTFLRRRWNPVTVVWERSLAILKRFYWPKIHRGASIDKNDL